MFLKSGGDGLQFPCALPFFIANLRLRMAEHQAAQVHTSSCINILILEWQHRFESTRRRRGIEGTFFFTALKSTVRGQVLVYFAYNNVISFPGYIKRTDYRPNHLTPR